MSNLFDTLGKRGNGNNYMNPMQAVQQLKNDPVGFMESMGFSIPNGVDTRNPQSIINGLFQTGQINNNRYQRVLKFMNSIPRR